MILLSFDTSAGTASTALLEDERVIGQSALTDGNRHSEVLLPMAERLLEAGGLTADDVDLFCCTTGPGSFTGVRIGVATVKGLAFGRNVPCIGVSALEALAVTAAGTAGLICPVLDARRNQVYHALFESDGTGIRRLGEDAVGDLDELCGTLFKIGKPVCFCGDAARAAQDRFQGTGTVLFPETADTCAAGAARAALRLYREGVRTRDTDLRPVYLRVPQAERERLERLNAAAREALDRNTTQS